jgi:sialidase-1
MMTKPYLPLALLLVTFLPIRFLVADDANATALRNAEPQEVVVFESGEDGYHTYRIPAVITSAKGTLLAFCEGRKNSKHDSGDIDLVLKRSTDGGRTWGQLQVVADFDNDTIGNPCPVLDRTTGRIWLPLTSNPGENSNEENHTQCKPGVRDVWMCYSDDEGVTWSEPENITSATKREDWTWYATGPGNGIQLESGRMIIPCDHRVDGAGSRHNSRSHVIYSDDHGKTWQIGGILPEKTNECQIAAVGDELILNMRSNHGENQRAVARSRDGGETWSELSFDATLIEPVCQASIISIPRDGDALPWLVFSNPASKKRERMTVRLSTDGGHTWPARRLLYPKSAAYSSLVALPNEQIGILDERDSYGRIVFTRFGMGWLEEGKDSQE